MKKLQQIALQLSTIDINRLQTSYSGLPDEFIQRAIKTYMVEATVFVEQIQKKIQQPGYKLDVEMHNLKTMSALIGAAGMADICAKYESAETDQDKVNLIQSLNEQWPMLVNDLTLISTALA